MRSKLFSATAPGSVFLLGEHAVLQGFPALIGAVNYRMKVKIKLRDDQKVIIHSDLSDLEVMLEELKMQKPLEFVIAAILFFKDKIKNGLEVTIKSEFSHEVGLGSSAAVTVAMVSALRSSLGLADNLNEIFFESRDIVRAVQGSGSGGDVVASVFGGIICYEADSASIQKLEKDLPLALFYSGSKTSTPDVIHYVNERFKNNEEKKSALYSRIGECTQKGRQAILNDDLQALGKVFDEQQSLMNELGVNSQALADLIAKLKKHNEIKGVKISGSGLGDCVVALGDCINLTDDSTYIPINISTQGVISA